VEEELGRRTDQALLAEVKPFESARLTSYVSSVLDRVAAKVGPAPRRFTVRVLDTSYVTVRSGPGGYVYVTRGLLAFLGSEAELAGALAHEVAHITRHHWRSKLALLESQGIDDGDVSRLSDDGRLKLLALMRANELEADRLAVDYLERAGYSTKGLARVIELFAAIEREAGGSRIPPLLRTHPETGARLKVLAAATGSSGEARRAEYLKQIDGLVFGEDPKHGFLFGERYVNPSADLDLPLAAPWRARLMGRDLLAAMPGGSIVALCSRSEHGNLEATRAALTSEGMSFSTTELAGRPALLGQREERGGLTTHSAIFDTPAGVFVLAVVAPSDASGTVQARRLLQGAARIEDPSLRNLPPLRVRLATLAKATTLREHTRRVTSKTNLETLSLLNGVDPGATLPAGTVVKRIDH